MTEPNEFTNRWNLRLLAAQRDLVEACGGIARVVERTGYSKSQVGRWNGGLERDLMPLAAVLMLEADAGRPLITAIMAEFHGRELSGEGEGGRNGITCLSALNADLVEVCGQMMVETVRAKADGFVSSSESDRIRALSRRAETIRARIDAELAGIQASGGLSVVGGKA
ncbi:hypothetical protein [Shinella sp. NM-101]|uniref:hypothetical protein n=1 Tax=Shinella sp. NM-101 TaxID=2744455 RepID=UPI001F38C854|nr:hypothetical protein [Shinella sp. NM-101]